MFRQFATLYWSIEPAQRFWNFSGNSVLKALNFFTDHTKIFYSKLSAEQLARLKDLLEQNVGILQSTKGENDVLKNVQQKRLSNNPLNRGSLGFKL